MPTKPQKKDVREVRLDKLQVLLKEHDNSRPALARTIKKAQAQLTQWLNSTRAITENSARWIEAHARKPHLWMDTPENGQAVQEVRPTYAPEPWPLQGVSSDQIRALPPELQQIAVDQLKSLVRAAKRSNAPDWRRIALGVAASADLKQGADAFTQFCLQVDKLYQQELAATHKPGATADVHRDQ